MKRVVRSGNSSHIVLPKRLDDKLVYVLVILEGIVKPKFHYKRKKTYMGKTYYQAEITDNAGTHAIWIEKDKIKEIFKR